LKRGDRVALWAPNRWEWPVVQLGLARAGLVLVSLNPAYRLSEVEYALNKSSASALIVGARFRDSDYRAMLSELAPELAASAPGDLAAKRLKHLKL
ncbi:AMP-binding protein, partial [Escherichia coli]|uniref:AMP-binding protein n=1 Tax=Escherichia coli TaxID=562 RepID=UPI00278BE84C